LGTVDGLIRVFADILDGAPAAGSGSGISRALISTQFSLAAALPVVLGERLCRRRANQLSRQVAGVRP
jgi:biopolymer transport protein ExbB/TolQ